jgi:hypothetical protein
MTTNEAIENLRQLGVLFANGIKEITGKEVDTASPLSNGLVAYDMLNLKGMWPYIDESVDIVLRIMYAEFIKKHGA